MNQEFLLPDVIADLPIASVAKDVCQALQHKNVLLSAEPGAGKSTGLPLALLSLASESKRIIMLEPRRVAAVGVSNRLAALLNEPLGQRVGLRMRGQTVVSKATCVEVVTEGVLTRLLQTDPTLDGIGWVIFDEFHERSLQADLGLALCLDVQQSIRDDLRLLLMSATLDMDDIGSALGDVSKITCKGRTHAVDVKWLGAANSSNHAGKSILQVDTNQVVSTISSALKNDKGDMLVFLPGVGEISRTASRLRDKLNDDAVSVLQLHSRASAADQKAAIAPSTKIQRRVILSTNIAETSVTIDGVRVVIDAGVERRARINHHTGVQQLETVLASQASATQRTGRAGRTDAGICYRLWSEHDHTRRAQRWQPEIRRADLSTLLLELGLWGVSDVLSLPWLEPPPTAAIASAEKNLTSLGMWEDGKLTAYGKSAATLPVRPQLAHMLLWASERSVLHLACQIAVLLEDGTRISYSVDVDAARKLPFDKYQHRRVSQLRDRVKSMIVHASPSSSVIEATSTTPSVGVLVAQAFPNWIAQRRAGSDARYALAGGTGAVLSNEDTLSNEAWLAIANMGGAGREARIFLACVITPDELRQHAPELLSTIKHVEWDNEQGRIVAELRECIGHLVVSRKTISDISDDETAPAMLDVIRKRGIASLPWNEECRQWQARMQLMATLKQVDSLAPWPVVDDQTLLDELDTWLGAWLTGVRSIKALNQLDLLAILKSKLTFQQQQALDQWLPLRYAVPSGSNIKLRYAVDEVPVLSVKLQEMLGCQENPSIAQGEVVLKVELLSPARRPVQVTTDLENFWSNSYPLVKKDLAGRYPKHDWPDDPLNAKPTAYAKRRKNS